MEKRILTTLFLFIAALLCTACTNPTHSYHPLEQQERSKGENVKYEGATITPRGTKISFESRVGDSITMFAADKFCYDAQNDYLVFPTSRANEGYYLVIPKDSVTLCKDGFVRDNSYFSRNHLLRGLVIGGLIGGGIGAIAGFPMAVFLSLFGDGSAFNLFFWTFTGVGAGIGATTGAVVDPAIHKEAVSDIQEACPSYFTEEEQKEYLNKNLCY